MGATETQRLRICPEATADAESCHIPDAWPTAEHSTSHRTSATSSQALVGAGHCTQVTPCLRYELNRRRRATVGRISQNKDAWVDKDRATAKPMSRRVVHTVASGLSNICFHSSEHDSLAASVSTLIEQKLDVTQDISDKWETHLPLRRNAQSSTRALQASQLTTCTAKSSYSRPWTTNCSVSRQVKEPQL